MSYLLDTNVVSEWVKPKPNRGVVAWLAGTDEGETFLSVVTLTELRYGVERMPSGARRERLDAWLRDDLPKRFEGRILTIDRAVADACGRLAARSESLGVSIEALDALLAATAEVHQLTIVTHNASHFQMSVRAVVDPWR
jgi:toxin FitB